MGSSDNSRLALGLGVFAATGVALVSFFLLKKLNSQSAAGKQKSTKKISTALNVEETLRWTQGESVHQEKLKEFSAQSSGDTVPGKEDASLEVEPQTSYIFVSSQDNEALENGTKKSSDRSSDESSYDVIDDEEKERMEKDVDEVQQQEEERLKDVQGETSMVIVGDLEKSIEDMSTSSVYASADETPSPSPMKDRTNNAREEEEDSGDCTVIKRGEGKSESSGNEDPSTQSTVAKSLEESTDDTSFLSAATTESDTATSNIADPSSSATKPDDLTQQKDTEAVLVSTSEQTEYSEASSKSVKGDAESPSELPADKIAEVLSTSSSNPANVTQDQLKVMASVLERSDLPPVQNLALDALVKVTSFSQNNANLRSAGIPGTIETLTLAKCEAILKDQGGSEDVKMTTTLCQVITNLTLDPHNCHILQNILPSLVDLALRDQLPESLQRSLFPPLINFSSDPNFHPPLTRLIGRLFELLDQGPPAGQIQCLRVLVNLSLNSQLVPNILAARSPDCLQDLLKESTNPDLTLRTLTLLLNLESTMSAGHLTSASLPLEDKAESPQTLHSTLTGTETLPAIRNKVFALTQHGDQDISSVAGRLHQIISSSSSSQPSE